MTLDSENGSGDGQPAIVDIQPGQLVRLPGADTPVPADQVIGFQSAYTRKTQELAELRKGLEAQNEEAEMGLTLLESFRQDPFATLDNLKAQAVAAYQQQGLDIPGADSFTPTPPKQEANVSSPSDDTIKALLDRLERQEVLLQTYVAQTNTSRELDALSAKHPDLLKNEKVRAGMAAAAQRLAGANAEDLFAVAAMTPMQERIKALETELNAAKRDLKLATPQLGFSNSIRDESGAPVKDSDEAFKRILQQKIEQMTG